MNLRPCECDAQRCQRQSTDWRRSAAQAARSALTSPARAAGRFYAFQMSQGSRSTNPVVSIVTAHGRQPLSWRVDERLVDLLNRHNVPWSGVSIYMVPRSGGDPVLCPCLDEVL